MNKRIILIGVIVLCVLAVAAFVLTRGHQVAPGGLGVSPTLAPPAPTGIFPQPPNVKFSFKIAPNIPTSLPIYTFQPASYATIDQLAARAATTLNLGATPSAITRGGSTTKTWSRPNEAELSLSQTNGTINLVYRQAKSSESPGALSPDVAVQQFLLSVIPLTPNMSIRASGTDNGPFDGLLIFDNPPPTSFTNCYYSYVLGTYPVISSDLSIAPISIIADAGGIIRFANITPPPTSIQMSGAAPLLTQENILSSLAAGRGVLLDTHSPQAPNQGAVPVFSSFQINDTKIVYAPQGNFLMPALYITGNGTALNGASQNATIFLWLSPAGNSAQP